MNTDVLVIGAGPAGLTAAVEIIERNQKVVVLESTDVVGGISQTVVIDGWRFDLGGHRFFTKVKRVEQFWKDILPSQDFLHRPRMSRIYYKGKFFDYPLKPANALFGLGILETFRCIMSYFWAKFGPKRDESNFEGWVSKRFGWRLYSIFFKTYTEKVWGIPATELSSAWAAQRIKDLSLLKAIKNAFGMQSKGEVITTLIDSFEYPRLGPGMMWETAALRIATSGNSVLHEEWPISVTKASSKLIICTNKREVRANSIISTMPLAELPSLLQCLDQNVLNASKQLKYRDFLTVGIVVNEMNPFPDNWIYIHSPDVRVGRIQNFRSWSPELVKPGYTLLGLEYFVNRGDDLWESTDDKLVELAKSELIKLNLVNPQTLENGYVVRVPKAYPVYDDSYSESVKTIADWLATEWPTVIPVGRNGMHRYNNQDHSMLTAMLAVENLLENKQHDLWMVNVDDAYHEESNGDGNRGGRSAPVFKST